MSYEIRAFEVPDEVNSGDSFPIDINLCCQVPGADPIGEDRCEQKEYTLEIERDIRGPFGVWKFPLIRSTTRRALIKTDVQLNHENCDPNIASDRDVVIDKRGRYVARAIIGDVTKERVFKVI